LYRLRLSAELVTLSGCATGLNVVVGGDEILGLTRGLLYAGAHALLLTLWDVNDESTAAFMPAFYRELAGEPVNKAEALGRAMRELREARPHPYYWAPFVMSGKYART
jgi:CHAT domain-containing protein